MAAIDKLIARMVQHNAERVVLCNDQPICLFVAGREASGAVLGAEQLRSMIKEVTPPEMRSQLSYKSSFQFSHRSQGGTFDFNVVHESGILKVTITPRKANAVNLVDLDNLDFSFDSPTQSTAQFQSSDFSQLNLQNEADHVEKIKPLSPVSTKPVTPLANNQARKKSVPIQRDNEKCGYCKTRISDEVESIPMHRGTENRIITIPRCAHCREEQKPSPMDTLYMGGGCLGSVATTAIYFMFVDSHLYSFGRGFHALVAIVFIFSPYSLWMIADGNITGHTKHPDYIAARAEGFTNNLHRP